MAGCAITVRPPRTGHGGRTVHCSTTPRWSGSGDASSGKGNLRMAEPAPPALLVRGARLAGSADPVDIACADGTIASIGPAGSVRAGADAQVLDAAGGLVTPPYVEPHVHLDSVLTAGEPRWNESGTLWEGIACW